MATGYYPQRNGEYVYDVTVTKEESLRFPRRYRARLTNAERIERGRLVPVPVDVPDSYGATVGEAIRALDAHFDAWRRAHPNTQS